MQNSGKLHNHCLEVLVYNTFCLYSQSYQQSTSPLTDPALTLDVCPPNIQTRPARKLTINRFSDKRNPQAAEARVKMIWEVSHRCNGSSDTEQTLTSKRPEDLKEEKITCTTHARLKHHSYRFNGVAVVLL